MCDEVPQSWAPGAPFLTWAPIGAPIGAPVCMSKWYEGQRKMVKMMADCRIFQKLFPEKGAVAKITLRHKADGPPLVRMRKERKETWLEMMNIHLV